MQIKTLLCYYTNRLQNDFYCSNKPLPINWLFNYRHYLPILSLLKSINDQICKRIGAVDIEYNQTNVRYKNVSIEKSSIWTLFYTFFACQFCARFVTLSKRKFVITEKEQSIL